MDITILNIEVNPQDTQAPQFFCFNVQIIQPNTILQPNDV